VVLRVCILQGFLIELLTVFHNVNFCIVVGKSMPLIVLFIYACRCPTYIERTTQ